MPSTDRAEAFGLVAVEAMACGLPVISTELGTGTSYHNIDGKTGCVVQPKDVNLLIESIKEICYNPERYSRNIIRERALDFSLQKFKALWLQTISRLEKVE